jgi:condensin complex subunit 2
VDLRKTVVSSFDYLEEMGGELTEDCLVGAAENDEEDAESGDDEGQEGRSKKRKVGTSPPIPSSQIDNISSQAARQASTLADSFSKIKVKAFDLEFTVDPLFKKTSADFDEGGAGGILMNHLGCDGNMKVVFDAGDAKLENDEDDEEDVETEAELRIDLSKLRGTSPLLSPPAPTDATCWDSQTPPQPRLV